VSVCRVARWHAHTHVAVFATPVPRDSREQGVVPSVMAHRMSSLCDALDKLGIPTRVLADPKEGGTRLMSLQNIQQPRR
jgi:hypothetical protein